MKLKLIYNPPSYNLLTKKSRGSKKADGDKRPAAGETKAPKEEEEENSDKKEKTRMKTPTLLCLVWLASVRPADGIKFVLGVLCSVLVCGYFSAALPFVSARMQGCPAKFCAQVKIMTGKTEMTIIGCEECPVITKDR